MMWTDEEPSEKPWSPEPVCILETLYQYDGPVMFTTAFGPSVVLFYKVDELESCDRFLACPTSDEVVTALREGRLSIRGALASENFWLVDLDPGMTVSRYWACTRGELPSDFLPPYGLPLHAFQQEAPDSIEEATSVFSVSFRGENLSERGMPFGLLKEIVSNAHDAIRSILTPVVLAGSRQNTFDYLVAAQSGSLVLSVSNTVVNTKALRSQKKYNDLNLNAIEHVIDVNAEVFFERMDAIVTEAEDGDIGKDFAIENFDILDCVEKIMPSEASRIEAVKFSARIGETSYSVQVDEKTGTRIRDAHRVAERSEVVDRGVIFNINARSQTLIFHSVRSRQVTCHFFF